MSQYDFNKYCDAKKLTKEIQASEITVALDYITTTASTTSVFFKATLNSGEITELGDLVTAHNSTPEAPVEVQYDADGAVLSRVKTTKTGWHYEPRSINFVTCKPSSHYNRKHNGGSIAASTDYGDAVLRFWDTSDTELIKGAEESAEDFQTRVTANCTKTCLDWHPTYALEIVGGMLQILEPPTSDAYMWAIIAPDIPEAYGGNVPFLAGGFNLKFFKSGSIEHYDGRSAKMINPDFVDNSSKFRIVVKHEAGVQIGIQVYFEHFRG